MPVAHAPPLNEAETVQAIRDKIASTRSKKQDKLLADTVDAIFMFCAALSNVSLHEYQVPFAKRMIQSILLNDGAKITALFSRQSGKTEVISYVVSGVAVLLPKLAHIDILCEQFPALLAFKRGIWIGIFAPVLDQSQTLFRRIKGKFSSRHARDVLSSPDVAEGIETSNGAIITFEGGSLIECRSAAPTSNIESKTYHLLLIDEAQDVETNKIRKSISPMGAYTRATMVMSGTCNTQKSAFYEQITKNKNDALRFGERFLNHFEYSYEVVQRYNERYRMYIQDEINAYGEESDEFRMSYRLEWIFERGMFISQTTLENRVLANKIDLGQFNRFRGWGVIGAIDFGKSQDSTVFTIGVVDWLRPIADTMQENVHYRSCVLDWLEIFGDDWNSQFYQIIDKMREYPTMAKLVCDATGVGAGMSDRLRDALPAVDVEDFVYSLQQKSDGYKNLNVAISKGAFWIPNGEASRRRREHRMCMQQLTDLTKSYKGQNMVCSAPDNIRGAHDDYPDSLMMFAWAAKEPAQHSFEQSDFSPFGGGGGNWILKG